MRSPRIFHRLRAIAAVLFAVIGLLHAKRAHAGEGDVARHLVFVAIDVTLAGLLAWRPRWALPAVVALSLQQIPSHGGDFLRSLRGPEPTDWASLVVVLFFPAVVALLLGERRSNAVD